MSLERVLTLRNGALSLAPRHFLLRQCSSKRRKVWKALGRRSISAVTRLPDPGTGQLIDLYEAYGPKVACSSLVLTNLFVFHSVHRHIIAVTDES